MKGISLIRGALRHTIFCCLMLQCFKRTVKTHCRSSLRMLDRVLLVKRGFLQDKVSVHHGYRICLDTWIQDTGFRYWIGIIGFVTQRNITSGC